MIYLISGVWFQKISGLDIAFGRDGAGVIIRTQLYNAIFAGAFGSDREDPTVMVGNITDRAGESEISRIALTDHVLMFTKKYFHRDDLIRYCFEKQQDGTWEGGYTGIKAVGKGFARCVLSEVPDDFLVRHGKPNRV